MAAAGDDDLGAFFSELQEVETASATPNDVINTTSSSSNIATSSSVGSTVVVPTPDGGIALPDPAAIAALIAAASKSVAEASMLASAATSTGSSTSTSTAAPFHLPSSSVGVVVTSKPQVIVAAAAPATAYSDNSSSSSSGSSLSVFEQQASSSYAPPPPPPRPSSGFSFTSTTTTTTVSSTAAALGADKLDTKKHVRVGAGDKWIDETLNEWPENDFRLFIGDLGNDVTTEMLVKEFQCYASFAKAKVVRGGWNNKSKGYGFVSMMDPFEAARAIREKNGKYLCSRPITVRKSSWKDREMDVVKTKEVKKRKLQESFGLA